MSTLLRSLVEHGNRKLAAEKWKEGWNKVSEEDLPAWRQVERTLDSARPPHRGGIFLPLPDEKGIPGGLVVKVQLSDQPLGQEALDVTSRKSVENALDAAWQAVRGQGPRPNVFFSFPFATIASVKGASLWLPVFLAAVRLWGEATNDKNILATGSFDEDIDLLQAKVRLMEDRSSEIGVTTLWVAARHAPAQISSQVKLLQDVDDSLNQAFRYRPWHSSAKVVRCHLFSATRRFDPPCRFEDHIPIELNWVRLHCGGMNRCDVAHLGN